MNKVISRVGITPVGSSKYRVNRLRFHLLAYAVARNAKLNGNDAEFIIRCDDTDTSNTNRSFLDSYLEVLESLDVRADIAPYDKDHNGNSMFQSERGDIYREFTNRLLISNLAYNDSSGAVFFRRESILRTI